MCAKTPVFMGFRFSCLSVPVPEEGFLLGCVFAIADYPEQMSDKQLLATWKRVSRAHRGRALSPALCSECSLDWTSLIGAPCSPSPHACCAAVHV